MVCAEAALATAWEGRATHSVNLKGHFDLWHAPWRWRYAIQIKFAEHVIVLGHRALAFVHLDVHSGLVVLVRAEDLRLACRDGGLPLNQPCHHAADGLNAERERRHIEQHDAAEGLVALAAVREDGTLHGGAVRHSLVGVDAAARLLAVEKVLEQRLHLGDTRRAADEHDLVHVGFLELGVIEDTLDGGEGLLEEVGAQLLESRARQHLRKVVPLIERVDLHPHLVLRGQRALGALDLAAELLDGALVAGCVGPRLALEDLEQVLDHPERSSIRMGG